MSLTEAQVERYSRHILLPQVGGKGQGRLLASSVAVAFGTGSGGAASVAAVYLAAAGVGRIGWCPLLAGGEEASVQGSLEGLLGLYGKAGAAESIGALNPDVSLERVEAPLDMASDYDLLILPGGFPEGFPGADEVDEIAARFESAAKPVLRGARRGWAGVVAGHEDEEIFDSSSPEAADGLLPAAPSEGVLGSMLAFEALRALLEGKHSVGSTMLARFDLSHGCFDGGRR